MDDTVNKLTIRQRDAWPKAITYLKRQARLVITSTTMLDYTNYEQNYTRRCCRSDENIRYL
jgi:hypothetical protein